MDPTLEVLIHSQSEPFTLDQIIEKLTELRCVVQVLGIPWVRDPCRYLIVPTGSSRSRWGGNKPARAFDGNGLLLGSSASQRAIT
jgi:hypothetical protein